MTDRRLVISLLSLVLVSGCGLFSQPGTYATPEEAASAAGWDPALLIAVDEERQLAVRTTAEGVLELGLWLRHEDLWRYDGSFGTTREPGPGGERVIVSGAISTAWQQNALFGTVVPGTAELELDGFPYDAYLGPNGTFVAVIDRHVNDVDEMELQAAGWRMLDAEGTVLARGHGDCCAIEFDS